MPHPADPAAVLARFGLAPGPAGWSVRDLLALARDAGLTAVVEPEDRPTRGRRFRALVFRPADPLAGTARGTGSARRHGATEEGALAAALASMLGRAPVAR